MRRLLAIVAFAVSAIAIQAQQYIGMSGAIQTPTAQMDTVGTARAGVHFVSREMTTNAGVYTHNNKKYDTFHGYVSITPFKWIELSYNVALMKRVHGKYVIHNESLGIPNEELLFEGNGYHEKDQYFSAKISILRENDRNWMPSVAIGGSDFLDSHSNAELYSGNVWLAVGKKMDVGKSRRTDRYSHELTINGGYRQYLRSYNNSLNGVFANITYRPGPIHDLLLIADGYIHSTHKGGHMLNIGAEYTLFNHFNIQAALVNGKGFSGGICYRTKL